MTVFFYDRTFEGLLTAVFDAYSRRTFPEKLLRTGEVTPLFTDESYTVVTQDDRAGRVRTALQRKLPREACNMLLYVWLSELEGSDELLFRYICKTFDATRSIVLNFGDADVLEVDKIARKVSHEVLYIKQFLRFQKAADDIFFAPVRPIYNALPLTIDHFTDRFADQQWVIYDLRRKYGYHYDLHVAREITFIDDDHLLSGKLDESLMAEDEKLFQDLWKGYFNALTIKERINPRLQRQHMPVRFWQDLTEKN
ncbi:MAG: TIGR03915 family putative DNA repair protein [Tannerella sp.]|jgi:probable DNA metabolism protein|nr:TIGR03915 family putative DNA repair protein [Tannerella sp.]